jgi:hypothetical protein
LPKFDPDLRRNHSQPVTYLDRIISRVTKIEDGEITLSCESVLEFVAAHRSDLQNRECFGRSETS